MNVNEQFKQKFNELDQLCKRMYPKFPKNFDAMRQFAYSLKGDNKNTLLNIISTRNINTHDNNNIISFNKDAVVFLQGLIDGANRKYHNGSKNKIDAEVENLRTKNLKIMGSKLNWALNKYSFLSANAINEIKNKLTSYIMLERKASGLEAVKSHYFNFLNEINLLETRADVKNERKRKKDNNLQNVKNKAINSIESFYSDVISETSVFNINKRNKAKIMRQNAINSINRCNNSNNIFEIVDDYEDKFDDLLDY